MMSAHPYMSLCATHFLLSFGAVISQPKASDKDVSLAWERIQKFLKLHLVPTSPGLVTDPAIESRSAHMNGGASGNTIQTA